MGQLLTALAAGLLFAIGLCVSGMANPVKVRGFLDLTGQWDPSLMFVMAGALAVYAPLHVLIRRRAESLFGGSFAPLTRTTIDSPLILGSAMFGAGWGLSGLCPGPALVNVLRGAPEVTLFVASMVAGFVVHDRLARLRRPEKSSTPFGPP